MDGSVPAPPLAVIVPVLDEPLELPRLLAELEAQDLPLEVVVVDGGSRVPPSLAPPFRLIHAGRGRGRQMSAGVAASAAPRLLFLHADTHLPPDRGFLRRALQSFEQARVQHGPSIAGHFALKFRRTQPGRERLYQFMQAKTRSNRPGTVHGDQGLLIGRDFLGALGGFDEDLPFFEDARLARRVVDCGRWVLLPGTLETSARRFETEGHVPRYALMGLMVAMHEVGCEAFLRNLPDLYRAQSQAVSLRLSPFLREARRLALADLRREPARLRVWGAAVRANAWQLGLALELSCAGPGVAVRRGLERWADGGQEKPAVDALLGLAAAGVGLMLPEAVAGLERLARQAR